VYTTVVREKTFHDFRQNIHLECQGGYSLRLSGREISTMSQRCKLGFSVVIAFSRMFISSSRNDIYSGFRTVTRGYPLKQSEFPSESGRMPAMHSGNEHHSYQSGI
jgi:hypothetical protein